MARDVSNVLAIFRRMEGVEVEDNFLQPHELSPPSGDSWP